MRLIPSGNARSIKRLRYKAEPHREKNKAPVPREVPAPW
jgi:hypothetical protein